MRHERTRPTGRTRARTRNQILTKKRGEKAGFPHSCPRILRGGVGPRLDATGRDGDAMRAGLGGISLIPSAIPLGLAARRKHETRGPAGREGCLAGRLSPFCRASGWVGWAALACVGCCGGACWVVLGAWWACAARYRGKGEGQERCGGRGVRRGWCWCGVARGSRVVGAVVASALGAGRETGWVRVSILGLRTLSVCARVSGTGPVAGASRTIEVTTWKTSRAMLRCGCGS